MPQGTALVRTRVDHRCRLCDESIPIGATVLSYTGVGREGWYTVYLHADCASYTDGWDDWDWENSRPGEISHEEVGRVLRKVDEVVRKFFGEAKNG